MTDRPTAPRRKTRRRGLFKKLLILAVFSIVLLISAVAVLVPMLAGDYIIPRVEDAAAKSIEGTIKIDSLSVSWTGKQVARDVELLSPDGKVVALANLTVHRSLLQLLRSPNDLGTVEMTGYVEVERARPEAQTNLERAITPRQSTPVAQQPNTKAITLPPFKMNLDLKDLRFSYRVNGDLIGVSKLAISGPLELEGQTNLTISGVPTLDGKDIPGRSISGSIRSGRLIKASGELAVEGSGLALTLNADLPERYAQLATAYLDGQKPPAAGTIGRGSVRVAIAVKEDGGRLVAVKGSEALSVRGPIPAPLIARLAPEGSLSIQNPGAFALRTTAFNLPVGLVTSGLDGADLRGGALLFSLETETAEATLTTEDGTVRRLRIEPIDLKIGSEDFSQHAFAQGDIHAFVDGTPAGTALLDATVTGLLTDSGTLAAIDRVRPSGQLRLVDVPASLIDPLVAGIEQFGNGFVREAFGETLSVTVGANARADLASADASLESPRLTIEMVSEKTTMRGAAVYDGDRIDAPGEALMIESSAGQAFLERLSPQTLEAMEVRDDRPIRLTVSARDVHAIVGKDRAIDWDRLAASVQVSVDRGLTSAEGLDRIVLAVDAPGSAPVRMEANATGRGADGAFSITTDLGLVGLGALVEADDPLLARGVRVDGLIEINGLPLATVERMGGMEPGELASLAGSRADGRISFESSEDSNSTTISLSTTEVGLTAGFLLNGPVLSSTQPVALITRNPALLLDRMIEEGVVVNGDRVLRISGPRELSAGIEGIELDLTTLDDAHAIAAGIERAIVTAQDLDLLSEDGHRVRYESVVVHLTPEDGLLDAQIIAGSPRQREIDVRTSVSLQMLLDGAEPMELVGKAQESLRATIGAPSWLVASLLPDQRELIDALLADDAVGVAIEPIAGRSRLRVTSSETEVVTTARLETDAISFGETRATVTTTPQRLRAVLAALSEDGETPTQGLRGPATVQVFVEPVNIPIGEGAAFELAGLNARAVLDGEAVVTGVMEREGSARDLGVRNASARMVYGSNGPTIEANAEAFDPDGAAALGTLEVRFEPDGRFDVGLTEGRPRSLDRWLAGEASPNGPFTLTFGNSVSLSARSRAVAGLAPGTDRIEVGIASPRVTTQLLADRSESRIALAEPFQVVWTMAPALFDELIAPLIADTEGSEIRLREAAPAAVVIRTLAIEKRDGAFDPATARIDAEFGMVNANFDALLGEDERTRVQRPIDLGKVQGTVKRERGGEGPIRVEMTALNAQTSEPEFTIEGELDTDRDTPVLSATARGDVPTALIDVLAGQRGLLLDALGETVSVQASAEGIDAERNSGRVTASILTGRTETTAFGRFENGALVLGDGAASRTNITLSEITPELSRRVFEPLFPLLKDFRKSRNEQPTMITVTSAGLAIPTDGDLSKLNGNINLNLGSVRFEAGNLLSTVLNATANRTAGQLGGSVPPVLVRFTNGVATYDTVDIPFGDFTLRTRGSVDLVNQQMDVLVLLPLDFLGGDLKREVQRNPLLAQIAAVPFRARGTIGDAKLELDPSAIQDILPGALEQNINELINQGLRDLFRR
ncbi:MAG: hypothetical protein ACIAQF_07125 [Phycisphaerales bacterium JB065]